MASSNLALELVKPKLVKLALAAWGLFTAYDTLSNQLELPKLRRLFGVSGTLLPWWGWLLVLQAILSVALFDYVRRNLPADRSAGSDESKDRNLPAGQLKDLYSRIERLDFRINDTNSQLAKFPLELTELKKLFDWMRPAVAKTQKIAKTSADFIEKFESASALRRRYNSFRNILIAIDRHFNTTSKSASEAVFGGSKPDLRLWRSGQTALVEAYMIIDQELARLGIALDYRTPPGFAENADRPVPTEVDLADRPREILVDLRRVYHQREFLRANVLPLLKREKNAYVGTLREVREALEPLEEYDG